MASIDRIDQLLDAEENHTEKETQSQSRIQ